MREDARLRIAGLLTTVTEGYDRVSMHGVRRTLLQDQADAVGLPLVEVEIPPDCPNDVYEERMAEGLRAQIDAGGIRAVVYGDLFLRDVREYRERQLEPLGVRPLFPLWEHDTRALARAFIEDGFRALLCVIDPRQIPREFSGRAYDLGLLADLPEGADPCGENGEFHTFVHDGPIFDRPVPVERGEAVERSGFWFCDLRSPTLDVEGPPDNAPVSSTHGAAEHGRPPRDAAPRHETREDDVPPP